MSTYKIIFRGKIAPEKDQNKIGKALARFLKLPESKAHLLFDGRAYAIKKNLEREKAELIQKKLKSAGIYTECKVEKLKGKAAQQPTELTPKNTTSHQLDTQPHVSCESNNDSKTSLNAHTQFSDQDVAASNKDVTEEKQDKSAIEGARVLVYVGIFSALFYFTGKGEQAFFITIAATLLLSFMYFAYYIYSEKKLKQMLKGVVLSLVLLAVCMAFPILLPILIVYTLYQLKSLWDIFKSLQTQAWLSVSVWATLYLYHYYIELDYGKYALAGIFFITVLGYSGNIMEHRLKDGLMKLSVMMLSMPLCLILLASIVSGLRNLLQTTLTNILSPVTTTQTVASHMRGDTFINSYTRDITKEVTSTVSTTSLGSGSAIIGSTNSIAKAVDSDSKKQRE